MPQGSVAALNAILVSGTPLIEEVEAGATVTYLSPGKFCIRGATDWDVLVPAGATSYCLGVCDNNATVQRTATPNTPTFTAGDPVRVLRGPIRVMCVGLANQNFTKGDPLITDAQGRVTAAAAIDATVDGGTTAVLGTLATTAAITPTGSIPVGGIIVGYAAETKTAASDFWVMVDLAI